MKMAMIGLGKMGANMATRLLRGGHRVVAYDLNELAIQAAEAKGAEGARALEEAATKLSAPRVVWVMVPYTAFIDPQLGRIGLSEKEAQAQGLAYCVAKLPMTHIARAI